MIKPTVGRIVDYWPSEGDLTDMIRMDAAQPFAAQVVFVHDNRIVNLAVRDHLGIAHHRSRTVLLQDDDPKPRGSHATWMDYQKNQAAKAAAAEAATRAIS